MSGVIECAGKLLESGVHRKWKCTEVLTDDLSGLKSPSTTRHASRSEGTRGFTGNCLVCDGDERSKRNKHGGRMR